MTDQNEVDFWTANTPGPITGVVGAMGTAASLGNRPGTSGAFPAGMSGVGLTANAATGAADILGIASDARNMHKKGGWSRFWEGFKSIFSSKKDQSAEHAERRSEARRLVVNSTTNAADLGLNQVPSATSTIMGAAGHAAPAVLGTMASGASMGINAVVAGRSAYRGIRAASHESNVNELLKNGEITNPTVVAAAQHHAEQMNKRKKRSAVGAFGATLGAVGGGLLLGGLLGATMLTPIGWGLAAAGGVVAAGLGLHKLWQWHKKRKAGQLGVERDRHAQALHTAVNDPTHAGHEDAKRLLAARGITPEQTHGAEGVDFLKRKAEAW